jgi:hypothetical protein
VFTYAKKHGGNRVTWKPGAKDRLALVVVPYDKPDKTSGFVASGRSLREVEGRLHRIGMIAFLLWIITMLASLLACVLILSRRDAMLRTREEVVMSHS